MTAPIVALACDPTSQYGGGRPEVTAGTVAETRVMVAAMTAVEREAALKEGGLMEEGEGGGDGGDGGDLGIGGEEGGTASI